MNTPVLRLRGEDGKMHSVMAIKGEQGPKGDPYALTETDKSIIVQAVLEALPDGDTVSY